MTKEQTKKLEEPKQVQLKDATTEQLKSVAFDVDQQIKGLQRHYNEIYNEIQLRLEEMRNGTTKK